MNFFKVLTVWLIYSKIEQNICFYGKQVNVFNKAIANYTSIKIKFVITRKQQLGHNSYRLSFMQD